MRRRKPQYVMPTEQVIDLALGKSELELEAKNDMKNDKNAVLLRRTLLTRNPAIYGPLRRPRRGDWLDERKENGQSFKRFGRMQMKCVPHATFRTIYLQPIGSFKGEASVDLQMMKEFGEAFFMGCEVEVLDELPLSSDICKSTLQTRINEDTQRLQIKTGSIMSVLEQTKAKSRSPRKELMTLALTMEDVYPEESYNFVYGIASIMDALGVWSFARLHDDFPQRPTRITTNTALRCVRIMLHECVHLFGLKHCIYYTCLMNGANHEEEMDRQPLHLCPVCLRKLQSSLKFDVEARFQAMYAAEVKYGFVEDAKWTAARLESLDITPNPSYVHTLPQKQEERKKTTAKRSKSPPLHRR